MKKYYIGTFIATLLLAGLAFTGCHKDDDTDSSPYLDGTMTFDLPFYARAGEKVTIRPYGVSHPEGGRMKVYVSAPIGVRVNLPDTLIVDKGKIERGDIQFSFTLMDSLATFSVSCVATATGYNSRSASSDITVVRPGTGGSLTGTGIDPEEESYLDERQEGPAEERTYFYTTLGDLDWFRNNLAYTGSGVPYLRSESVSYPFGRYYTYEEALEACPEGWRLPSDEEWAALCEIVTGKRAGVGETIPGAAGALMGDVAFNGYKMWEFWPEVKITNQTTLAFLPAGYADVSGQTPSFQGINKYAAFWTSTLAGEGMARYRYLYVSRPDIYGAVGDTKSLALSVRCVRETAI